MFNYKNSVRSTSVHKCAAVFMLFALGLGGCKSRDEATVGTPANPLVVVLSPAHAPSSSPDTLAVIKKQLEAAPGMPVD